MGESLLRGWLSAGWDPQDVVVAERSESQQAAIRKAYNVEVVASPSYAVERSYVVILAVKPQDVAGAMREVPWKTAERKLLISVCAGVPIALIEKVASTASV